MTRKPQPRIGPLAYLAEQRDTGRHPDTRYRLAYAAKRDRELSQESDSSAKAISSAKGRFEPKGLRD